MYDVTAVHAHMLSKIKNSTNSKGAGNILCTVFNAACIIAALVVLALVAYGQYLVGGWAFLVGMGVGCILTKNQSIKALFGGVNAGLAVYALIHLLK